MRNFEQTMGLWLNEPMLLQPEEITASVNEIADAGFGIVRIFLRNTNYTFRSPEVVGGAIHAAAAAHARGLKVAMDFEPHVIFASDMGRSYPDSTALKLVRVEGDVRDGFWTLRIPHFGEVACGTGIFDGIEAAFLNKEPIDVPPWKLTNTGDVYGCGDTVDEHRYVEGRPGARGRNLVLRGRLGGNEEGTLLCFVRFRDLGQVDFAAPGFKEYCTEMLELYRDADLDGVGWDEPAIHNDWDSYRYGDRFAEFFNERCGYSLRERLHLLEGELTPGAIGVRLDYYTMLNEALFEAQRHFIAEGERIFGKKMITGTHHTWQGEGGSNDYRSGAVDYYRLTDGLDAGYTDCCWADPRSVAYSYTLGQSLGRLTPSGECECNTWHYKPSIANTQYNARLMSLMNITWFNIWYGRSSDTCLFPDHYTWETQVASMLRHRDFQLALAGAAPETEIGMLHDYAAVCSVNKKVFADIHKGLTMNLATRAIEKSLPLDFLDSRLIGEGTVENGRLCCALGSYRIVIVPCGVVLARAVWDNLMLLADAGGSVIFAGAPPEFTEEGGSLAADFAQHLGIKPMSFAEYHRWFVMNAQPMPTVRPESYSAVFPLAGERVRPDAEGRPGITENAAKTLAYMSGYEPDLDVIAYCRDAYTPAVKVWGDALYRFYRRGETRLMALISGENAPLDLVLEYAGCRWSLNGDADLLLEIGNDSLRIVFGFGELKKI